MLSSILCLLRFWIFLGFILIVVQTGMSVLDNHWSLKKCLCCEKSIHGKSYCNGCFMRSDMIDALESKISEIYTFTINLEDRTVLDYPSDADIEKSKELSEKTNELIESIKKTCEGLLIVGVERHIEDLEKSVSELSQVAAKWEDKIKREKSIDRLIEQDVAWS